MVGGGVIENPVRPVLADLLPAGVSWEATQWGDGSFCSVDGLTSSEASLVDDPPSYRLTFDLPGGGPAEIADFLGNLDQDALASATALAESRGVPCDDWAGDWTVGRALARIDIRFLLGQWQGGIEIAIGLDDPIADLGPDVIAQFAASLAARGADPDEIALAAPLRDGLRIAMAPFHSRFEVL